MKLTVGDLVEYLKKQDQKAKICYFDSSIGDYVQLEDYLFKKVSNAKREYQKNIKGIFSDIEDENERNSKISEEMSLYFKFVEDSDILIGLKSENSGIIDNITNNKT